MSTSERLRHLIETANQDPPGYVDFTGSWMAKLAEVLLMARDEIAAVLDAWSIAEQDVVLRLDAIEAAMEALDRALAAQLGKETA